MVNTSTIMDFTSFRRSEELSDIEIVLKPEDRRYSLHKFPLYTKSDYIKKLLTENEKLNEVILENFPGGTDIFELVVDFCYSHYVEINKENVVDITCAARRFSMQGRSNLEELACRHLTDLLTSAKLTRNIGTLLDILLQCTKDQDETREEIADNCIKSLIEIWIKPPSRFPYRKDTGPSFQDLSAPIVKKIIKIGKEADVRTEVLLNVIKEYTKYIMEEGKREEKRELKLELPDSDGESEDNEEVARINGHNKAEDKHDSSDDDNAKEEDETKEEITEEEEEEAKDDVNAKNDDQNDTTQVQVTENDKNTDVKPKGEENEPETDQNPNEDVGVTETDSNVTETDSHVTETDPNVTETDSTVEIPDEQSCTLPENNEPELAEHDKDDNEDNEKRKQELEEKFAAEIDDLISELPEKSRILRDNESIRWIVQALEIANRKNCDCRQKLLYAASTVLAQIPEESLKSMPPELVCDLLQEAGQSGFHFANTVCVITDFYILDQAKEGKLSKEHFMKLAKALPDGFRTNLDTLFEAYGILAKDFTPEEKEEILKTLDLSCLSEDAIQKAYDNESIPAHLIVPALINRCSRLRGDLEKAKDVIKLKETEVYRQARIPSSSSSRQVYYTPRDRSPQVKHSSAWPLSARVDTRYESSFHPSHHAASQISGTSSLPSSPRHKPTNIKPNTSQPISSRYYVEVPTKHYSTLEGLTKHRSTIDGTTKHRSTMERSSKHRITNLTTTKGEYTTSKGDYYIIPTSTKEKKLMTSQEILKPQPIKLTSSGKIAPVTLRASSSLPGTPRKAWRTPQKAPLKNDLHLALQGRSLPDYSSSGIGPQDIQRVMYDLALTSPRLSYMCTHQQYEVPERDLTGSLGLSPRRSKTY